MNIYERFGLTKVLNARGPSTILGAAKVKPAVRQAVADALAISVEMVDLQAQASKAIYRFTEAEAGCVTGCAAAGIAVAVAACMTGDNLARIKELPNVDGLKNEIVIQKGHVIGAGDTPVYQLVRMTGGNLIEIAEAADCTLYQLEEAFNENTAAAIYIKSSRAEGPGMIPPKQFIETCKAHGVPVIVDDASGLSVRKFIAIGADLVVFSGQKWLGAPTAGVIAGKRELVYSCFLQENGIGRPMKVGKEGIIGVMAAIEDWENRDWDDYRARQMKKVHYIAERLAGIDGVKVEIEQSSESESAGWVRLTVDPKVAKITAFEVNRRLAVMNPVIKTHDYNSVLGYFALDPVYLEDGEEVILCDALISIFAETSKGDIPEEVETPTRRDQVAELMRSWKNREGDWSRQ